MGLVKPNVVPNALKNTIMPGKEIKELRMMGLLDEALDMAVSEWREDPDNNKTKINLAWVYFALCKRYAIAEIHYPKFVETFDKLERLGLFADNNVLSNSTATCIVQLLSKVAAFDDVNKRNERCDDLFRMSQALKIDEFEEVYHDLFCRFSDFADFWDAYPDFCHWWGLDNLRPMDFRRQALRGGKKRVLSLGETAYIACIKKSMKDYSQGKISVTEINSLIGCLDYVISCNRGLYSLEFYKYTLMHLRDGKDEFLKTYLPVVKKRSSEFWTWLLLAEVFVDDEEKYIACLLRASSCKAKEVFLSTIRLKLARYMIGVQDYVGARYEIEQFLYGRQFGDYIIPDEVSQWTQTSWYQEAHGTSSVMSMPSRQITESILISDLPVMTGVVTYVNLEKQIATLVCGYQCNAFYKYEGLMDDLQSGDILKFKADVKMGGESVRVVSAQLIDSMPDTDFYRSVRGTVTASFQGTSYFLNTGEETIYVPNAVFDNNDSRRSIYIGEDITCRVVYAYNRKQDRWNWVVVKILR